MDGCGGGLGCVCVSGSADGMGLRGGQVLGWHIAWSKAVAV